MPTTTPELAAGRPRSIRLPVRVPARVQPRAGRPLHHHRRRVGRCRPVQRVRPRRRAGHPRRHVRHDQQRHRVLDGADRPGRRAGPVDGAATHGRYYVLQFVDAWTDNFAYVGQAGHRHGRGQLPVLVPPGWSGEAPTDATVIRFPTRLGSIVGRWAVTSEDDLPEVHDLQAATTLRPLDASVAPAGLPPVTTGRGKRSTSGRSTASGPAGAPAGHARRGAAGVVRTARAGGPDTVAEARAGAAGRRWRRRTPRGALHWVGSCTRGAARTSTGGS